MLLKILKRVLVFFNDRDFNSVRLDEIDVLNDRLKLCIHEWRKMFFDKLIVFVLRGYGDKGNIEDCFVWIDVDEKKR